MCDIEKHKVQWEYKIEQVAISYEIQHACQTLNRYGEDGWEAVSVWSDASKQNVTFALSKRISK
jgi:hypothetical protein